MSRSEAENLVRTGVAALQRRDGVVAKTVFQQVIDAAVVDPPWLLLAQACRIAGDAAGEKDALDRLLSVRPRDLIPLIMRGDCHVRDGDSRAAVSFYRAALDIAQNTPSISPRVIPELQRIEALVRQINRTFSDQLSAHLDDAGFPLGKRSPRLQESLDILNGEKRAYFQEPTSFFLPRLPHIQFYERQDFPWLPAVEALIPAIQAELQAVVADDKAFKPYIEDDPNRPVTLHALRGDPSWSAFYLLKAGERVEENAARCPRTMEALSHAPIPQIKGRSPMALFSLLRPGAHIAPHTGLLNTRLICHIPLIVPDGCALRVGNELRTWEDGKALIFDDSIEHEAWNRGSETRVILLFEIWRPEISAPEREALTAMFEAITDFQGHMPGEGA